MADYVLHDGREITVDKHAITHKEWKRIFDKTNQEPDEPYIAKACGLTLEEVENLSENDWRALLEIVLKQTMTPDPH